MSSRRSFGKAPSTGGPRRHDSRRRAVQPLEFSLPRSAASSSSQRDNLTFRRRTRERSRPALARLDALLGEPAPAEAVAAAT